jgi:hypothetical protein
MSCESAAFSAPKLRVLPFHLHPRRLFRNGGARINHVFFREFDKSLRAVDPMQGLSHQEIVSLSIASGRMKTLLSS